MSQPQYALKRADVPYAWNPVPASVADSYSCGTRTQKHREKVGLRPIRAIRLRDGEHFEWLE
eukprot:scaffold46_cov318-Pavlova_lutheri.AAC.4